MRDVLPVTTLVRILWTGPVLAFSSLRQLHRNPRLTEREKEAPSAKSARRAYYWSGGLLHGELFGYVFSSSVFEKSYWLRMLFGLRNHWSLIGHQVYYSWLSQTKANSTSPVTKGAKCSDSSDSHLARRWMWASESGSDWAIERTPGKESTTVRVL